MYRIQALRHSKTSTELTSISWCIHSLLVVIIIHIPVYLVVTIVDDVSLTIIRIAEILEFMLWVALILIITIQYWIECYNGMFAFFRDQSAWHSVINAYSGISIALCQCYKNTSYTIYVGLAITTCL